MIKYNPKDWVGLIFEFHKSDTLRQLYKSLLLFALYTLGVVYLELNFADFHSTITIHSLFGFVIGLLLVFRTNTAYERWWEGRKQWGALTNDARNLAMKINAALPKEAISDRIFYSTMISNFVYSLKNHLRDTVNLNELKSCNEFDKTTINNVTHKPNSIASIIFSKTHELYKTNVISGDQLITIDKEIKGFAITLGSCERIKKTPIPYSYNIFLKKFIFVYTVTMPFGLVYDYNYWAILISTFTMYVFVSLELLAEEIEDPFGSDANDLPIDNLCKQIKENVKEILLS